MKVHSKEPIAIIGASCRFPGGVTDLDSFWALLASGTDAVTSLPPGRCSLDRYFSAAESMEGSSYTKAAGIIEHIKEFDSDFFGISRKEAKHMDPQQRLVLEATWEALEDALIPPSSLRGTQTGVFMGASNVDMTMQSLDDPAVMSAYSMTGSTLSIIANRISYIHDLHGPSLTVDTACSSSLVAIHMACEALRHGDIPLAIAGGVNVLLAPYPFIGFASAHMLSPDGRCKVFDARGNGYVRSEGTGVIILKTLRQAQHDNDTILGLIAASAVNSDGRTTGIALPNEKEQIALLNATYAKFGLKKNELAYVEAHGTGTAAGDPIEANAIGTALGKALGSRPLLVGSVKSNIGHLESAAGMAGIIKALLVLKHRQIPANLHFEQPNPAINFAELNLKVPTCLTDLPATPAGALISINSFGFGGTNAHVVLRQAPLHSAPQRPIPAAPQLRTGQQQEPAEQIALTDLPPFLLSARSELSLCKLAESYAARLEHADHTTCADTAATLALHREHLRFRTVLSAPDRSGLVRQLKKMATHQAPKNSILESIAENCPGVFVFSGNGSQWPGMGKELLDTNPDFTQAVAQVDSLLAAFQDWSILDILRHPEKHEHAFSYTEKSQPLLFAVQVGLVTALRAKGLEPQAVMGHSVGEVAAAWASGALSLQDAVTIIRFRSLLQAPLRGKGHMAVANLSEGQAQTLLAPFGDLVEIAAVNTRASLTLAGDEKALREIVGLCKKQRISAKLIDLPYPFHTRHTDALHQGMLEALRDIQPGQPDIPFFSTVQGYAPDSDFCGKAPLNAEYWWQNVRRQVVFSHTLQHALQQGFKLFLEIGPNTILSSYIDSTIRHSNSSARALPTLKRGQDMPDGIESIWKNAWKNGWTLKTETLIQEPFIRQNLPVYPWNREFLWADDTPENQGYLKAAPLHPLLGWLVQGSSGAFTNRLHLADYPWLADHGAGKAILFPAAGFIEQMLAAAMAVHPRGQQELERVTIQRPLHLVPGQANNISVFVDTEDGGLRIESRTYMSQEPRSLLAKCRVLPVTDTNRPPNFFAAECSGSPVSAEQTEFFGTEVSHEALYSTTRHFSLNYGPAFRTVEKAWVRHSGNYPEVLAKIAVCDEQAAKDMLIPPTSVDGAFHTLFLLLNASKGISHQHAYLPAAFGRVTLFASGIPHFAYSRLTRVSPRSVLASFDLLDEHGEVLLRLEDCRFRRAAWLEEEKARPVPHAVRLLPAPHPGTPGSPVYESLSAFGSTAQRLLALAKNQYERDQLVHNDGEAVQGIPPRMLLRFAAISSAYETVLRVCEQYGTSASFTCEDLIKAGQLDPRQEPWLRHMLQALTKADMVQQINGGWRIKNVENQPYARSLWRTVLSTAPDCLAESTLLASVMRQAKHLVQNVAANLPAQVVTPALARAYYSNSPAFTPFLRGLEACVSTMLKNRKPGQIVNILQIAKDSQRLLSHMLPLVTGEACRYVVAEPTTAEAEALALTLDNRPQVHCTGLNLDEPQSTGSYQLIITAWSLHEQQHCALALANCLALLAPGGILCVLEHEPDIFADFIFGSNPSWWDASADKEQPVSRFQRRKAWQQQLYEAGFAEVIDMDAGGSAPAFLLLARRATAEESAANATGSLPADSQARPVQAVEHNPEEAPARWILLADEPETASAALAAGLQQCMAARGLRARILHAPEERFTNKPGEEAFAACVQQWSKLFERSATEGALELVNLRGYSTQAQLSTEALDKVQRAGIISSTVLAQAWDSRRADPKRMARLWLITGGALAEQGLTTAPVPSQGALWGFGRVLMNEMRGLDTRLCDLHGEHPDLDALVQEFLMPSDEQELVFAGGLRLSPRLTLLQPASLPGERTTAQLPQSNSGATLTFNAPGRLQNLYWQEMPLPPHMQANGTAPALQLSPHSVEQRIALEAGRFTQAKDDAVCIAVKAVGLNFRDVMWSMGMLLDEALENGFSGPGMGIECAGVVVVGDKQGQWVAGDEVICFAPSCFSTHIVTNAGAITRKPVSMSFAQAATIPVAFMTAWYSLKHLAAMQPGERLLVHGAAGGVGLAAIQIAAHLDLEVYATAGSPEKHDFLHQLGVKHIYSSRSLAFAGQIMESTRNKGKSPGVDAVLNSLAGEAIAANMSVLRPFGRFLELGKRDFYADSPLRLNPFRNNITFYGVDLDQLLLHRPALTQNIFSELMDLFAQGKLRPLPYTCFPRTLTVDAFQSMQQSSHIGKIIVCPERMHPDKPDQEVQPLEKPRGKVQLKADATYLVTGGTSGFGLASAVRLAKCGAKHLVLLSRNGIKDEAARLEVAALEKSGVSVAIITVDLADCKKLHTRLHRQLKQMPPLHGVIHAAAILDDGIISKLTPERIVPSLAAKSLGAWNVHTETQSCPLDFFVLYSSATTAFGNPGQSSYVAANSMLESLAAWRVSQGLPAQVIGWGPISDTGMVQRNPKAQEMLTNILGVNGISSKEALDWLEHCISNNQAASHFFSLDWQRRSNLAALKGPRFQLLRSRRAASSGDDTPVLERIQGASPEEAVRIITTLVREEIAAILGLPPEKLAVDTPIVEQGMDSLMGVELGIALEQKFNLNGYTITLSEKTTAAVLGQTLYAVISGNSTTGETGPAAQDLVAASNTAHPVDATARMLSSIEHKHAIKLSAAQRSAALDKLKGETHE